MDVRCPQCATTFEFDERQLRAQLVTLKCSVCQHLFRLELNIPAIQESQHRWMVRQQATGDILYFGGFDVLHQWIMQQRIVAQDAISRTGNRWIALSDVAEFAPVFQVVESISALSRGRVESSPQPVPAPDRDRVGTMQQFISSPPLRPQLGMPQRQPQPSSPPQHMAPHPPAPQPPAPQPQRSPATTGPQRTLPPRPQQPSSPPAPLADAPPPRAPQTSPNAAIPAQQPAARTSPQRAVADDQWTIGDLDASVDDVLPAPRVEPRASRALPILLVILLLGAAAGGAAWRLGYLGAPAATPTPAPISPEAPPTADPVADPQPTIPAAEPVVKQPPDAAPSAEVVAALGAARAKLSETAQQSAAKADREAKRTDPKLLAREASKALSREQFAKARELFHQSIQQGEATPENVTGLGWALLGVGNAEAAVAQFNKALFINDGFEDAYIGLGKAERQRGKLREALKVYERHLKRFPDSRKASISRHQIEQLRAQLGE